MVAFIFCFEAHATPTLQLDSAQNFYNLDEYAEYLEDISGQLDIRSIKQQPEKAWKKGTKKHFNFGFSHAAYWFRINLDRSELQRWLLEIGYPLLDEITFYLFSGERLLQEVKTGDTRPYLERPLKFRKFILPLRLPPTGQVTFYLRVKSAGAVQVPLNLWKETSFYERDEIETAALGIYFGAILIMIFYNLFLYIKVYEPAYLYYVLYMLVFALFTAGLSGWGYKYLWPEAVAFQQYSLAIFIILGSIFVCRFIYYFLDLPKRLPRIGNLLTSLQIIHLFLLSLLFYFSYSIVIQMALALIMVVSLIALYCGILLWRQGEVMARYFTVAWSTFLVAVILATLEKFALLPLWIWADVFLPAGMVLELALLSLALGERINSEKQQRISAQREVITLQERNQAELGQKVHDRTVELEDANARLELLATMDGLTGVFNRRHFLELSKQALSVAKRYRHPISVIMLDIDFFKAVNDSYGHEAGDKVLQHVVGICNILDRGTDIFGRLGGEEFCLLLLEAPAASAHAVAERLRHEIEASAIDYEGQSIAVTVSLGVYTADPPQKDLTINQLLRVADGALYEAKNSGRNRVVLGQEISDSSTDQPT